MNTVRAIAELFTNVWFLGAVVFIIIGISMIVLLLRKIRNNIRNVFNKNDKEVDVALDWLNKFTTADNKVLSTAVDKAMDELKKITKPEQAAAFIRQELVSSGRQSVKISKSYGITRKWTKDDANAVIAKEINHFDMGYFVNHQALKERDEKTLKELAFVWAAVKKITSQEGFSEVSQQFIKSCANKAQNA